MSSKNETKKYIAFLLGINVGGHKKAPMAELKRTLADVVCNNVITLLNSGNVVFDLPQDSEQNIEKRIARESIHALEISDWDVRNNRIYTKNIAFYLIGNLSISIVTNTI